MITFTSRIFEMALQMLSIWIVAMAVLWFFSEELFRFFEWLDIQFDRIKNKLKGKQ